MINNRQNGRRGRGRNGARPQGGGAPRPEQGNRIDNRARGNASQLHEKYKTLARDAQMQGDRVLTEYYHQFADHYFRVLSESRARFEENRERRPRDDYQSREEEGRDDYEGGEDETGEDRADDPRHDGSRPDGRHGDDQPRRDRRDEPRGDRPDEPRRERQAERGEGMRPARLDDEARPPRGERQPRAPRVDRAERPAEGEQAPMAAEAAPERPRRTRRAPAPVAQEAAPAGEPAERIDVAVLPPAFGPAPVIEGDAPEADRPRRRPRRVRAELPDNDTTGDAAA